MVSTMMQLVHAIRHVLGADDAPPAELAQSVSISISDEFTVYLIIYRYTKLKSQGIYICLLNIMFVLGRKHQS